MSPQRIQRQRTTGWRMPPGTVYVGRPTIWGNPFVVGEPCGIFPKGMGHRGAAETLIPKLSLEQSLQLYEELMGGCLKPEMFPVGHLHFQKMQDLGYRVEELRGKDLACWCPLDKPCHADVLLRLANPELQQC